MNLLSYYKSWSSHARWWMLLVGGIVGWALPAETSSAAERPGAVQSAPVEAPQFIEIVPQGPVAPARLAPTDTKASPPRANSPVQPSVPVPAGAIRSDLPAQPVATTAPPVASSSRRNSPPAPTKPAPTVAQPVAAAPSVARPTAPPQPTVAQPVEAAPPIAGFKPAVVAAPSVAKPVEETKPLAGFKPAAPAVSVPVTAPRQPLEPVAQASPLPKAEVKPEPKAELNGFAKAPVKPVTEIPAAPAAEIPSDSAGQPADSIVATPFPGDLSQAERMAGDEALPPVLDAETARRMLAEKRAAEAAEAARRRLVERQAMEAAAAQEAAKLLRPASQASEPTKETVATTPVTQPQPSLPVYGPELPGYAAKPSVPVHTASTPVRPAPASLPTATKPAEVKPVSTEKPATAALPQANSPARIGAKPAAEQPPAFRDRQVPEAAELKREAFQPAGSKPAMKAVDVPQLAQVPGAEAQPIVPAVPPPAVPVPVAPGAAPALPPVPAGPGAPRVAPVAPDAAPAEDDGNPILSIDQHFTQVPVTGTLEVQVRHSLLIRCKSDIYRTAVVDPQICDVVQFTPREISIIGKGQGATNVTFWFNDGRHQPVNYVVRVKPDLEERRRLEGQYKLLQDILRETYPDSKVYLIPVADKLIVKGQARDAEEAAAIMATVRGQTSSMGFRNQNTFGIAQGSAAQVLAPNETGRQAWPRIQVINLLRVPGIHQVALRVKIAELNRSAARGFGVDVKGFIDFNSNGSGLLLSSILNAATGTQPALIASFSGDDIQIGVRYLQQHGVIRVLSEPTLVTMSGQPATFVAGGEFAVPTLVGSAGVNAVTTDFRAYGAIVSFMPIVLDKDRIRLQVAPEFSQIDSQNAVNGIPGMKTRAVTTTVEMREGQTLAIAGLLDDSMKATNIGDLPLLANIFGRRDITRNETELIILVTPELIQPMEPEEVPPLPGYDVTEPNNRQFYWEGKLEGTPTREYRSTIWHRLRSRYTGGGSGMISGPFGHGN